MYESGSDPTLPCVDVVIAVLNGMPYLYEAVASALAQEGVHTRVYVVDGGSDDGTIEAAQSWVSARVSLIADAGHLGACEARNVGVQLGSSPWICFLDSDDVWPSGRTQELLAAITSPANQIATGNMLTFSGDIKPEEIRTEQIGLGEPAVCIGSTLFSRDVYNIVGDFNDELVVGEFVEWMARARSMGVSEVRVPTIALLRRHHDANTSVQRRDSYSTDMPRIAREHLARIRAPRATSS
jgi:hypothetical protein